jgi:hypothetical protein
VRATGDRPSGDRPFGDRPSGDRPRSAHKAHGMNKGSRPSRPR